MKNYHLAHPLAPLLPARQRGAVLIIGLVILVAITLVGVAAMRSTTLQEKMAGNLRDSSLAFQAAEAALRRCDTILQKDFDLQQVLYNPPPPNRQVVNTPPAAPTLDQDWPLGSQTSRPSWSPFPTGFPISIWVWSLDNDQASFPAGTRLSASPGGTPPLLWWMEHDNDWWGLTGSTNSSKSQMLPASSLEEVVSQPRCILERYIYATSDNSVEAIQFRRSMPASGVVIVNGIPFGRERHYYRNTARGLGGNANAVSMLQAGTHVLYYIKS